MCNLSDDKTLHVIPPNKLENNTRPVPTGIDTGRYQTALPIRHADNYTKFTRRRLDIRRPRDAHTKRRVLSQIQLRNTRVHHGAQANARRTVQNTNRFSPTVRKFDIRSISPHARQYGQLVHSNASLFIFTGIGIIIIIKATHQS